eukprot:934996-Pyramimonas_sp.AAC.1
MDYPGNAQLQEDELPAYPWLQPDQDPWVMTMWAGQIRIGFAVYHSPGRTQPNTQQSSSGWTARVTWFASCARSAEHASARTGYAFLAPVLRPSGEIPLPDLLVANG